MQTDYKPNNKEKYTAPCLEISFIYSDGAIMEGSSSDPDFTNEQFLLEDAGVEFISVEI